MFLSTLPPPCCLTIMLRDPLFCLRAWRTREGYPSFFALERGSRGRVRATESHRIAVLKLIGVVDVSPLRWRFRNCIALTRRHQRRRSFWCIISCDSAFRSLSQRGCCNGESSLCQRAPHVVDRCRQCQVCASLSHSSYCHSMHALSRRRSSGDSPNYTMTQRTRALGAASTLYTRFPFVIR